MKVISFSLDPHVLQKESVVSARSIKYGDILEKYSIIVPSEKNDVLNLSSHTTVYGTGGTTKLMQFWQMYKIASQLIKKNECDVITSQDTYFLGLLGVFLSRMHHLGLEVQVLGIEKLNIARKMLAQFVLKRAGSIRVLSLGLKKRLQSEFGIREDRMMLVPIYVDVSSLGFSNTRSSSEENQKQDEQIARFEEKYKDHFNIVSVNRLVPIKNISMQLQAVQTLSKQFPNILLHIVGDGPQEKVIQKEIEDLHIEKYAILEGFKAGAELSPFFTQSDCFVLTSDFEGYGMVIVEAATAGLPIVMTDVGCAGEVIIHGESGMIVQPKDTKAFTEALLKVIEDNALRDRLRNGAQEAIAQLPSFDTVLKKYQASWQQALQNRK